MGALRILQHSPGSYTQRSMELGAPLKTRDRDGAGHTHRAQTGRMPRVGRHQACEAGRETGRDRDREGDRERKRGCLREGHREGETERERMRDTKRHGDRHAERDRE